MNLKPLFDKQRELDERIVKEKGLEGQDLLPKKILALRVELGELANEWRGFKFWSERQKPRRIYSLVRDNDEADFWQCGNGVDCNKEFDEPFDVCPECGWDTVLPYKEKNPLLEEYVDCLHFILSMGNDLGFVVKVPYLVHVKTTLEMFQEMYRSISKFYIVSGREHKEFYYNEILSNFMGLGKSLGFTWEQIEQAYLDKNKVNHQRQDS